MQKEGRILCSGTAWVDYNNLSRLFLQQMLSPAIEKIVTSAIKTKQNIISKVLLKMSIISI